MCSAAFSCRGLGLELMLEVGAGGSIKGEDKQSLGKETARGQRKPFFSGGACVRYDTNDSQTVKVKVKT